MSLSQGHVWVCVCVCDVAASSVCWGDASKSQWKWPDGKANWSIPLATRSAF